MLAMLDARHDLHLGSGIALQLVSDQHARHVGQALEELAKESFGCLPVPPTLHQDINGMAVLIDRAPEVMVRALNRQHDLIEMPFIPALRLASA